MRPTATLLESLPETQGEILSYLKAQGSTTLSGLADRLNLTREAVRQHLATLQEEGWIQRVGRLKSLSQGRPAAVFALTPAGDHLFPKFYDSLSLEFLDTLADNFGKEAVRTLLTALTDKQVARWETKLRGLSLPERIGALTGIYFEQDPYTHVEQDERGYLLVERNCPYLNLALQRPQLCSVTLATLSRLLGVRVRREAKFQEGDRHCAFRVLADQPLEPDYRFSFETESLFHRD